MGSSNMFHWNICKKRCSQKNPLCYRQPLALISAQEFLFANGYHLG